MGFGAAQVSKGEKEMLDQVRAAVSQAGPGAKSIRSRRPSAIECFCCRVHSPNCQAPGGGSGYGTTPRIVGSSPSMGAHRRRRRAFLISRRHSGACWSVKFRAS
jgi:hypothetical protein